MLINSANTMGGSSEPNGERGFGRVHLEAGMPLDGAGNLALFVTDSADTEMAEFTEDVYTFEVSRCINTLDLVEYNTTGGDDDTPYAVESLTCLLACSVVGLIVFLLASLLDSPIHKK